MNRSDTPSKGQNRGTRKLRFGAVAILVALALGMVANPPAVQAKATRGGAVKIFYQSNYGFMINKWNQRYYSDYTWTDDGCSVPKVVKVALPTMDYASKVFNRECQQHDFGYRNFGGKKNLDNTHSRKLSVDGKFHTLMDQRCDTLGWYYAKGCKMHSYLFWKAVEVFGKM